MLLKSKITLCDFNCVVYSVFEVPISVLANDNDPGMDEQFAEPEVDAVRRLKDEEFERSRRQSERFMQVRMQPTSVDETAFGV